MDENYEIVRKLNRLESTVDELSARLKFVLKTPSILIAGDSVPEKEACLILHIGRDKIRRLRKSGELPFMVYERKVLYRLEDLRNYIFANTKNLHALTPENEKDDKT